MSTRIVRNLILMSCLLFAVAPALSQGQQESSSPAFLVEEGCDSPLMAPDAPDQDKTPRLLEPEKIWTNANPCFVSCPSGGFIDCTWSWAGDPTYCCFKTATRCQSYKCSSGTIILSKVCL